MLSLLLLGLLSATAAEPEPVEPSEVDVPELSGLETPTTAGPTASPSESPPPTEGSAPASVEPSQAAVPSQESEFPDVLAAAKRAYFSGQNEVALSLLRGLEVRLLQGEEPNLEHALEAMIFNGELLLAAGESDAADLSFRWVLERDPEYPLSPYHHPVEVVGNFENVRSAVLAERSAELAPEPTEPLPPPSPRPPPPTAYLPFGLPQFMTGRPVAGVLFGALQAGLGLASLAIYAQLDDVNTSSAQHPLGWSDQQVAERVRNRRFLLQWPLTVGFYGAWVGSHAEARRAWRVEELQVIDAGGRVSTRQPGQPPPRFTLSVSGRF